MSDDCVHMIILSPFLVKTALSMLQHARQGDCAHQVFPRVLLRVPEDALRHPAAEVPQVQRRLRGQRLPPHLHHLEANPAGSKWIHGLNQSAGGGEENKRNM